MQGSSGLHWHGRRLEGVIFDVDGTLTDSIDIYYQVFQKAVSVIGLQVKREDVLESMAATGSISWDAIIPPDLPDRRQKIGLVLQAIEQRLPYALQQSRPARGAKSLLEALDKRKIKIGAVTTSQADALYPLENHSLIRFLRATITYDDGFPPKPDPAGLLECMRRLGLDPQRAIAIGDSPVDIIAGEKAGALTIGLLSGIGSRRQLEAESPTAIADDLTQVQSILGL